MGKYAISKFSIILYHIVKDLSIYFAKKLRNFEKYFFESSLEDKNTKRVAAIAACKSHFDSGYIADCDHIFSNTYLSRLREKYVRYPYVGKLSKM